jgi:hypothetical protein
MIISRRFITIAFLSAAMIATSRILSAQSSGTVSVTVTDSISGAAVVGARVTLKCEGCYGRYPTDSTGRYRFKQVPSGAFSIEIHCPSRTLLGAQIVERIVSVSPGEESLINVRVPAGQCSEPRYSERVGVFSGYWTPGFESSKFVPCADSILHVPAPLLPGKQLVSPSAWAEFVPSVKWPQKMPAQASVPTDRYRNPTYFVVWRGVLKGPGQYGHLGVSDFSMLVDSVLAVSSLGPANCQTR